MDKEIEKKLNKIRSKFIAKESKEKEEKKKTNKEELKWDIVIFIVYLVYFAIALLLISLWFFITKFIWFLMVIFWLWYLCINYD